MKIITGLNTLIVLILLSAFFLSTLSAQDNLPENIGKKVIELDIPAPKDSAGGLITADINNDNEMDFLVTVPGHLAAYNSNGKKLWILKTDIGVGGQSESQGLPGHNAPGVCAGDMDNDGKNEVVFLTKDSTIHFVDGSTGREKFHARPPVPKGARRWEIAMLCDLHGTGKDQDILLQATNEKGYRTGRYIAAYSIKNLLAGKEPLWTTDRFISCAHNGARIADLNNDMKDEILGATVLDSSGKIITQAVEKGWHMDSVFVADVRPDIQGLEVVLLEEGANHIQLLGMSGPIWRTHHKRQEPQNAAVGRFKPGSDEIFIWCRSRYSRHQVPFVFGSKGKLAFEYKMDDVAPEGWTDSGVEIIYSIDWTGAENQLACATERHTSGDVCIFEPLTGRFVLRIDEKADRLYVADVSGDWREEIVVLNGSELHIYQNLAKNPKPKQQSLWKDRNYRRMKQYYNYYSP